MLLAAAALCAWTGLGALAFAMDRHYAQACGARASYGQRIVLRVAGWALLALGFASAIVRDGASFGTLLWVALLGVFGFALVLLLACRPRLAFLATGAAALSALAATRRVDSPRWPWR